MRFLETPATVWGAESVLIDEISRCKPEHQNRLFSLVHERRVQGIALGRLRYRWAAMNPCGADQAGGEDYLGSEPLDPALADRFAVIVEVADWDQISDEDRRLIADPAVEGAAANDGGRLKASLAGWQAEFAALVRRCPAPIVDYTCAAAGALRDGGLRISPRRTRLVARTLLAAHVVAGGPAQPFSEAIFRLVLEASLPQRAWGELPDPAKVAAAHRLAWDACVLGGAERWVHRFHRERSLAGKAALLLASCPSPDVGTLAVEQLLANEPRERAAAFAFAAFPAAVAGRLPVGAEAVNDLGRIAQPLLTVNGEMSWHEPRNQQYTRHPRFEGYAQLLASLSGARRERARQLLYFCLIEGLEPADPRALEEELEGCVQAFARVAS